MTAPRRARSTRSRQVGLALTLGGTLMVGALGAPSAQADPGDGTGSQQGLVSYNDFSSTDGIQLLGDAAQRDNRIQLTDNGGDETGVAWANQNLDPSQDFSTSFVFDLHDAYGCKADGLDFVIQDAPDGALTKGIKGGGLGYGGITPSFAAEFDIYGGNQGDPNDNHVGFLTNGNTDNSSYPSDWTNPLPDGPDLYGAGPVHAWFDYTAATHQARLYVSQDDTKPGTPTLDVVHDISADITTHSAYVGFTAATGGCNAVQDLVSWNATGVPGAANDTLALSADPASPAPFGPTTTLSATVQRTDDDAPAPTGPVDFFVNDALVGSGDLNDEGVATFTLPRRLVKGTYQLRADYAGDGVANPATATQEYSVGPVAPAVVITPADNTFAYGSRVVVNVTGPTKSVPPTGRVDWYDGETKIATSKLGGDGRALLPQSTLQARHYDLVAKYVPDGPAGVRYTAASSGVRSLDVTRASSTTTLTSSANPVTKGDGGRLTAQVSLVPAGPARISGTVTFTDTTTSKVLGKTKVNPAGQTLLATRKLAVGGHDIVATYSGDGNAAASSSDVYHLEVVAP